MENKDVTQLSDTTFAVISGGKINKGGKGDAVENSLSETS